MLAEGRWSCLPEEKLTAKMRARKIDRAGTASKTCEGMKLPSRLHRALAGAKIGR